MPSTLSRRVFLLSSGAGLAAAGVGGLAGWSGVLAAGTIVGTAGEVTIERFDDAGRSLGKATAAKVVKTAEEWQAQLSALAFVVARQEGTERAFTGPNWDNHAAGLYRCVCCDSALFSNDTKYDSRTGWPSFWQPLAKDNVVESVDTLLGAPRTAVSCALCDAHLGHVFADGPPPTGLRYCMNGVAMRFIPQPAA